MFRKMKAVSAKKEKERQSNNGTGTAGAAGTAGAGAGATAGAASATGAGAGAGGQFKDCPISKDELGNATWALVSISCFFLPSRLGSLTCGSIQYKAPLKCSRSLLVNSVSRNRSTAVATLCKVALSLCNHRLALDSHRMHFDPLDECTEIWGNSGKGLILRKVRLSLMEGNASNIAR